VYTSWLVYTGDVVWVTSGARLGMAVGCGGLLLVEFLAASRRLPGWELFQSVLAYHHSTMHSMI